jgi:hypothetical protein
MSVATEERPMTKDEIRAKMKEIGRAIGKVHGSLLKKLADR